MSNTTLTVCQGILHDSGGANGIYGINENITTVINTGGVLTLTFINQFCLESNLDFVTVYDGPNSASPLLGQFTGNTLPPMLTANSGIATIVLTSDNNVSYCGFSLQWNSIQPPPVPPVMSVNNLPLCNSSQLVVNFSTPLQCAWLNTASFLVLAGTLPVAVTNVQPGCTNNQTSAVTLTLAQPISYNCAYTVNLQISIPDGCGVLYQFSLSANFQITSCPINATITSNQSSVCPGACASIQLQVLGCNTYTYAWNNGLPATQGPHQVCPMSTTTYSVTITEVETGNTTTRSFTLVVEANQILTLPQTVCQSVSDIVLQANGTGTWSGPGVLPNSNLFDPDGASAGLNFIYFQTANCLDSVAITVIPIQTAEIAAACPGTAPFQLNATPGGGSWSGPFTNASGIFNPSTQGSYQVTYTLGSCTDLMTVNVANIAGNFTLDPICQSVALDTIVFSPLGGSWSGAGIVNSFLGTYAPGQMPAGNNSLTYQINGCNQIFTVFIKEIAIGDAFQTACPTQAAFLPYTSNPIPAGGVWSGPGITNVNTGLFNPSALSNNSFNPIIYNAPNGCSDTTVVHVLQTVVLPEQLNFCLTDSPFSLSGASVTAQPEGGVWSGPGVSLAGPGNYSFSPSLAGVGQHTLVYTKNTCTDNIVVTVYPPALEVSTLSFCSTDAPQLLQANLLPGGTWTGSGISNAQTGLFNPAIANPGTYFVYWQSPSGCRDSIEVTIELLQQAAISGLSPLYCLQDQQVTFSASPAGGTLSGSLSVFNFNLQQLGAGTYNLTYTYDGPHCPPTTDNFEFVINPALSATASVSDDLICDNQSTTISVSATGGNTSAYNYAWSNGGISVPTNTSVPGVTTTISVLVSDGCSPPVLLSTPITVLPPIEVVVTTSDTLCVGQMGSASAQVITPGNFSITWNGVPGAQIEIAAGSTRQLLVTDLVNGCTFTQQVTVPSYPVVTASFSLNPNAICIPFDAAGSVNFIDLSQNAVTGLWTFGNGNTLPYVPGQNITQSYPGTGNYTITLKVANAAGCEASTSSNLCILPEVPVFIPDIFSPNDDGNNDVLFVRGFGLNKIDFRIYNRWGEEVFFSNDAQKGWDGQHRGQPAASGSYFYTFKAIVGDGSSLTLTGEVALVR